MDSVFGICAEEAGVVGRLRSITLAATSVENSMSYESLLRGDDVTGDHRGPESVRFHRGNYGSLLDRHHVVVDRALRDGMRGVRALAPHLLGVIADPRTLRLAWDFLARRGGSAPGPDGMRYSDLTSADVWELCRCLGRVIRGGTYGRGPDRTVRISKGAGRGERPLVLSNIADRVVERAMLTVLQPVLDSLFDERSLGSRPGRGPLHALALAERLVLDGRRHVWLVEDLRNAFLHVPLPRLTQVMRSLLPDDGLADLIRRVLARNELPGLRQGGPLSSLLLNLYLNHFLDRRWRRDHPDLPMIRVVDDILVACRSAAQAQDARAGLERLLTPSAMPLKGTADTSIHDLRAGAVDWVGFSIAKAPRGLAIRIGEGSWDQLDERLGLAHAQRYSPLRAPRVVEGWISQRGPCYRRSDGGTVCRRILEIAASHAFDEMPAVEQLKAQWHAAHQRWQRRRSQLKPAKRARMESAPVGQRPGRALAASARRRTARDSTS